MVLGTLEYLTRGPRSRCRNLHPACNPQDSDFGPFDPRVQTRRDQQGLVDWTVVWKEPRCARDVPASPRIRRQDHRTFAMELGLLDRTYPAVYAFTTYPDPLCRQVTFDVAL